MRALLVIGNAVYALVFSSIILDHKLSDAGAFTGIVLIALLAFSAVELLRK